MTFSIKAFFLSPLLLLGLFLLPAAGSAAAGADSLVRLHWLGLNHISTDTNSARFLRVWRLPETTALVNQTLDKLSRWPGHGATNAASARLRPLLEDFISSEFYLELGAATNSQFSLRNSQLVLALRLPANRVGLWQTNLAVALESLSGDKPEASENGWVLSRSKAPARIEFCHVGDWTLFGFGLDQPLLKTEFARRFADNPPHPTTNFWLEGDVDTLRLAKIFPLSPTGGDERGEGALRGSKVHGKVDFSPISHLHLTLIGQNGDLHTHATLELAHPIDSPLPAWQIPTNLINGPLTSFTAVRGFSGWLAALPAWQKLQLTPPPDQAFWWSQAGIPFQTYLAAPLPGASNQLAQLAPRLVRDANPWLATNAEGSLSWNGSLPGIVWKGANLITPFLIAAEFNHHDYLLGGFYPPQPGTNSPPPLRVRASIEQQPNVVYCQLEGTGSRVEDGFWLTQVFRLVFHKPQMAHKAVGTIWLKQVEQLLGESLTTINCSGPRQLVFERTSTTGFTALELHLLADWLESPQFPRGLHTFLAPPDQN